MPMINDKKTIANGSQLRMMLTRSENLEKTNGEMAFAFELSASMR